MSAEWKRTSVSTLIENNTLQINDGYRAKNSELSKDGIPFARAQNINGGFHFEEADCFPHEDLGKVGIKKSQPGDVVFTSKGTVGRFAFVKDLTPQFVYSPQLCFWRSLNQNLIFSRWLFYWMHSREFYVQYKGVAGQTDMAEFVSLTDQRGMNITLPPITEQKRIANILGTLDDKIELNRRMNKTLEAMAQALFKSWFVDFEPVKAKAAVRREHPKWSNEEVSRAACPKLAHEISILFPDSFQDSELGIIPKGWEAKPLKDIIDINPLRRLAKGAKAPYLGMANVPTQGYMPGSWIEREFGSGTKFINEDTLLARITPCLENGKTAYVNFLKEGEVGWGSTEFIVMRPKAPIPPFFAYLLARHDDFRTFAIQQMTGSSGRQRVPGENLRQYLLALPKDVSIFRYLGESANIMFRRIKTLTTESCSLADQRHILLQRLLSSK